MEPFELVGKTQVGNTVAEFWPGFVTLFRPGDHLGPWGGPPRASWAPHGFDPWCSGCPEIVGASGPLFEQGFCYVGACKTPKS